MVACKREPEMNTMTLFSFLFGLFASIGAHAQTPAPAKSRICMDIAHKQRFWNDPADMSGMDVKVIERVKYMTGEFVKTATAVNASVSYLKNEITPAGLQGCDLVFIHIPSAILHPGRSAPYRNTSPAAVRCSWSWIRTCGRHWSRRMSTT